jgi:hypothetical protein
LFGAAAVYVVLEADRKKRVVAMLDAESQKAED